MFYFAIILFFIISILIYRVNKDFSFLGLCFRIKTVDGSPLENVAPIVPGKTIFGNNFDIISMDAAKIFDYLRWCTKQSNGKSYIHLFLECAVYNIVTAEDAESVFQSQALLTKGVVYDLLHTFVGTGLLTSTDKKWHSHRKLLTPAFHFNILKAFVEIFKDETDKLIKILNTVVGDTITLLDIIPKFTLNNVCETALGVKLDELSGSEEYAQSIHDVEARFVKRAGNPILYYDIIYRFFGDFHEYNRSLQVVHNFSSNIIRMKRAEFERNRDFKTDTPERDEYGKKKRYAMLDTLLDAEAKGLIDHPGICEEVDTFVFEGYDTTSTCLMFTLMNLAINSNVQEKCFKEIEAIEDLHELGIFELNQLEYLECVIKESLRLYPPVPVISRQCNEKLIINGLILPKNTQIQIHIFDILRDSKHFKNPQLFDPDRFLSENFSDHHPFSFVPFSAGSRNCIGQKFAMLEVKILLASIIKNFILLPVTRVEDLIFENGLLLRTKNKIQIKIGKRLR